MGDIREEVAMALVKTGKWRDDHARLAERARYCCEYCDLDLLASVENYKLWQKDHIIPTCSGGLEEFENLAIACRHCNWNFKRDWDPRTAPDLPTNPNRDHQIKVARAYIVKKRAEADGDLRRVREIVGYPFASGRHA